jgi:predicted ABC-type transport system involved in lysophospholipase L1 biosynthesis ATPase subunit
MAKTFRVPTTDGPVAIEPIRRWKLYIGAYQHDFVLHRALGTVPQLVLADAVSGNIFWRLPMELTNRSADEQRTKAQRYIESVTAKVGVDRVRAVIAGAVPLNA